MTEICKKVKKISAHFEIELEDGRKFVRGYVISGDWEADMAGLRGCLGVTYGKLEQLKKEGTAHAEPSAPANPPSREDR